MALKKKFDSELTTPRRMVYTVAAFIDAAYRQMTAHERHVIMLDMTQGVLAYYFSVARADG